MQVSHTVSVVFDEPNLVSCAGLVPALALAKSAGLHDLAAQHVRIPGPAGANADIKIPTLIAGMVAGADSIDDMGLLRHGGLGRVFTAGRAPTTLGTHLRGYTPGDLSGLAAVADRFLAGLTGRVPALLAGADQGAFLDIDDSVLPTYGYAKQGAAMGYSLIVGLNMQVAAISTEQAAPIIVGSRLRKGNAHCGDGSAWFFSRALATARRAGVTGPITLRADAGYYRADLIGAARAAGVRFSVTAKRDAGIAKAITAIPESDWTPIDYPSAAWDDHGGQWVSDAQVAEIPYTAFTRSTIGPPVTTRLIVRRVRRHHPAGIDDGQGELFPAWQYHPILTDSTQPLLQAEATHRDHALIEQVIADLKAGPLAHLPSGKYTANAAWTILTGMAFNLTRALGTLASTRHAHARGATIRAHLITVPARIASSARKLTMHLPRDWPWANALTHAFTSTGPPHTA